MTREELIEELLEAICLQGDLLCQDYETPEGMTDAEAYYRFSERVTQRVGEIIQHAADMGYQVYLEVGDEETPPPLSADSHKH